MRPRRQTETSRQGRAPRRVVGSVLVAGLVAGGAATAYWAGAGRSDGEAHTATTAAVTVSAGAPTAGLRPGGTADLALTITNPNPFEVTVPSLVLDPTRGEGGFTVDGAHPGCASSSFSLRTPSGGWVVPARSADADGSLTVAAADAVALAADAADACQGAVATVHLKAGP